MAEKRMIAKVISISEKVNMLPDIFDMLLFTWMIPHSDDFGRLAGSPAKVKALVVPMLDKSLRNVADSLQRLHDQGLIYWYEADDEKIIQIIDFEKHQSGLHKRTKSKFPEYTGRSEELPGDSGNFREIPSEEKGREENRTEQNGIGTEENGRELPLSDSPKDSILKLINDSKVQNCDLFSLDIIYSFIGKVEIEVIEAAIKKSSEKHINYAITTLRNWSSEGKTTLEQVMPKVASISNGSRGRNNKPEIAIVSAETEHTVTEEEFAELMKMAEQMAAAKEGKKDERDTA